MVSGAVAAVNLPQEVTVYLSAGSTTSPDGTRVPVYSGPYPAQAQIQSLTFRDLIQTAGLNLQGTRRAIYFYGNIEGIVRPRLEGGDLVVFADESVWLVAIALETWPNWSKVAATLQTDPGPPNNVVPPPTPPILPDPWPSV